MEDRIITFIGALRASGVRVSLAESADAFQAIDRLGVKNRHDFRLCLQSTLVKESRHLAVFDKLFPIFFGEADPSHATNIFENLTSKEAEMLGEALQQYNERLRQLIEKLLEVSCLPKMSLSGWRAWWA